MATYTMYIDLYPGLNPTQWGLQATTTPGQKTAGVKRIAFDVVIPDEIMFDVDGYAAEVTRPKVVEGE